MRKFGLVLSVITLTFTGVLVPPVKAQEGFTAQKAYEDFQYQNSLYVTAEAEYQEAKTFYKKNPTLQLREEARKKTLTMLRQRDQLVATHLTALRMELAETTGLTPDEKGGMFGKLDPDVKWYLDHMASYQEGDELSTLFTKSDEAKSHYGSNTKFYVFEALFDISFSKQIGLRADHEVIYAELKNFINDRVAENKMRIDPVNRWLNDTDSVLVTISQNEALARKKISTLYSINYGVNTTYNASIQVLLGNLKPLKLLNNYLTELLISTDTLLR